MKTLALFLSVAMLSSCATVKTGIWSVESGAEKRTTLKHDDTAFIPTAWGHVEIQAKTYNAIGMNLAVTLVNDSGETIAIRPADIQLQTDTGEIVAPMSEQELAAALGANSNFAAAVAGTGYVMAQAANSSIQNEYSAAMLKDGALPSHARKSGTVFYHRDRVKPGAFTVRVSKAMLGSEHAVRFIASDR